MRIPRKTELTKTRRPREKAVLLFGYDNKVKWLWEGDRKRETGMDADGHGMDIVYRTLFTNDRPL